MRIAFVCLLALVFAAADAAPAPLPKGRDPSPSTRDVERHLREHFRMQVQSIQACGKRTWIAVGDLPLATRYRYIRSRGVVERVLVVTYQGKDGEGRPEFTLIDLESARRGVR
jgi:hypothetical protein